MKRQLTSRDGLEEAEGHPARQVAGQGLQCSAEHAAHWGEQVAPAGAVLVARPGSSTSQGQGLPWPGLQAGGRHSCTMSMCIGCTPHSPLTPFESGHLWSLVLPLVAASCHYWSGSYGGPSEGQGGWLSAAL
ncbi:hypothetical protein HaLaN_15714 [Haematococcus lacustris]|uniref:Uncharacterized protein n=1 Tax=Haematococcus lacustris TaxID=44745 RepID=A0A699Z863_HAELA|nr:hypothetical protein HaLaN_15714 [Haematococcus lacustris]